MPEPTSIPLVPRHADRPTVCPSTIPLVTNGVSFLQTSQGI